MNIYKAHSKRKTLIHHCIILANYSPSSGMVGMVRICKNARQAPRAASQEARMRDVIALPTCLGEKTLHTRTVVRECCKGDEASQWENWKFDPLPRPNPLTDRHKKLHT